MIVQNIDIAVYNVKKQMKWFLEQMPNHKESICDWCYKPIKENKYNKLHRGKPVCSRCAMLFDVVDYIEKE